MPALISNRLLKNLEFVIPNGVCEVRNLSFLDILIEEGFLAQKTCNGELYLASLGMTAERVFQQPAKASSAHLFPFLWNYVLFWGTTKLDEGFVLPSMVASNPLRTRPRHRCLL